jgi:hypothetical protein
MLTALLAAAEISWAGGRLPCYQARVFGNAAVNALVLPFRYTGKQTGDIKSTGSRLAALIQQETLFAMLKYGSVGATELVSEGDQFCDVREVVRLIMDRTDNYKFRSGHAMVIIWGRIYEEGQDVYVQSYIRFLRRDASETIQVNLLGPQDRRLHLTGSIPAQAVAMVPRKLTKGDIYQIERNAAKTLIMHKTPEENIPGKPIVQSPYEPLTYGVVDAKDGWMKIRSYITGKTGWVRVRDDNEAWSLRRFLPELGYLDGVIGYLRLRTAKHVPLTNNPRQIYKWIQQAFTGYETVVGKEAATNAVGLSKAMMGLLLWAQPELINIHEGRKVAANLFQEAVENIPGSPEARVLAIITIPFLQGETTIDKRTMSQINVGLLGALAIDPRSSSTLQNLRQLYELAVHTDGLGSYGVEELNARLAVIKAAQQYKQEGQ